MLGKFKGVQDYIGLWGQKKGGFQGELVLTLSLQRWLGFKEAEKETGEGF